MQKNSWLPIAIGMANNKIIISVNYSGGKRPLGSG